MEPVYSSKLDVQVSGDGDRIWVLIQLAKRVLLVWASARRDSGWDAPQVQRVRGAGSMKGRRLLWMAKLLGLST